MFITTCYVVDNFLLNLNHRLGLCDEKPLLLQKIFKNKQKQGIILN